MSIEQEHLKSIIENDFFRKPRPGGMAIRFLEQCFGQLIQLEGDVNDEIITIYAALCTDEITTLATVKENSIYRRTCATEIPRILSVLANTDNCEDYAEIYSIMSSFADECARIP